MIRRIFGFCRRRHGEGAWTWFGDPRNCGLLTAPQPSFAQIAAIVRANSNGETDSMMKKFAVACLAATFLAGCTTTDPYT
ncbi:MAG: hypothetical protein ACRECY_14290, partial [Phyllobacterium sp.]